MNDQPLKIAQNIASRLAQIEGVRAVVLGGSWARGAADANSDIDLGIYYDGQLDISSLRSLAAELDDSHSGDSVTKIGGWGPWINGGAWLTVNGQRVDWIYRDLSLVHQIVEACIAGNPKVYYQPGHPHGFHTHIYLAEIALCQPLHDPYNDVASLKALAIPYPPALKRALINTLWEAEFALDTSRKSAARGDVFHVTGGLFRCAAVLVQVLFALNEQYWMNEKGSIQAISRFPLHPQNWEDRITRVLAQPGDTPTALLASLTAFDALVSEVRALCEK